MAKSDIIPGIEKSYRMKNYAQKTLETTEKMNKNTLEILGKIALYKNHAASAEFYTIA